MEYDAKLSELSKLVHLKRQKLRISEPTLEWIQLMHIAKKWLRIEMSLSRDRDIDDVFWYWVSFFAYTRLVCENTPIARIAYEGFRLLLMGRQNSEEVKLPELSISDANKMMYEATSRSHVHVIQLRTRTDTIGIIERLIGSQLATNLVQLQSS